METPFYVQSFEDDKKRWAELREMLIEEKLRQEAYEGLNSERHLREFPEYDYLLVYSPSQSLYLIDDTIPEAIQLLEKEIELNKNSSDYGKSNTAREEANGGDVVSDGVESGLENGSGQVAGHSQESRLVSAEVVEEDGELDKAKEYGVVKVAADTQEAQEAEVESGLTTSKVNEACKVVDVLENESSGSDVYWETEAATASPGGKTGGGGSSRKTASLRKRKDESGDYESDFKRGRSET